MCSQHVRERIIQDHSLSLRPKISSAKPVNGFQLNVVWGGGRFILKIVKFDFGVM